jgi:hypothetical protein
MERADFSGDDSVHRATWTELEIQNSTNDAVSGLKGQTVETTPGGSRRTRFDLPACASGTAGVKMVRPRQFEGFEVIL